jgi:hypothetical protein
MPPPPRLPCAAAQVLPWARGQLEWQSVATPLTHQHFRRRLRGAYCVRDAGGSDDGGGGGGQPRAVMAMRRLFCVGDGVFPYVGTPAVAATGMWVANTLAPVWKHWAAADAVDGGS